MAVRREKVILELEDHFTGPLGRPAAAVQAFEKTLGDLDKTSVRTERSTTRVSKSVDKTAVSAGRGSREIDKFSGRLRVLADVAAILGPALIPIGAVAVPAITGLAAQFGAAAIGAGTALIAFQGVGDALTAVNDAALEPSAENLEAARIAMERLGPEAQSLVRRIQEMRPAFTALRDAAAAGLFPGLESALGRASDAFPRLERILFAVGDAAGAVADEFAAGIAGPRGQEFLRFVEDEVPGALRELGEITGNLAAGLAEMWMAFTPLNRDFSGWLLDVSQSFDTWAQGLSQTEGFQEFVAYLRENGPRVADALGNMGRALLDIVEAAAPIGGQVLEALSAVAEVVSTIVDTEAGPVIMATVTALALLSRGMAGFAAVSKTTWASNIRGAETFSARVAASRGALLRGAGALAGFTIAATGAADGIGLTNAASGALLGSLGGPWGAAVGGAVGLTLDLASASKEAAQRAEELARILQEGGDAAARESIVGVLESEGILADAENLGLALDRVAGAAMGSKEDLAALRAEQERLKESQRSTTDEYGFDIEGADSDKARERAAAIDSVIAAITGENEALEDARGSVRRKEEANRGLADSYEDTASAADRFRKAVDRANAILDERAAFRAARDAARGLAQAFKEAPKDLKRGTAAYDTVQEALDEMASSALTAAGHLKGMDRVRYLKRARGDFVDAAAKLLGSREAARKLADELFQLDKIRVNPKIDADASGAMSTISQVDRWLSILDGKKATTYVETIRTRARSVPGLQMAGGGTVPGQRMPYRDKTLLFAAPGEEIITNRNGEADRFRADRAAGRIPRYENGGTVAAMNRASSRVMASPNVSVAAPNVTTSLDGARFVLEVPGMGQMVANVVESQMGDARRHDRRQERRR